MLLVLFLALFGPFVMPLCFGIVRGFLMFIEVLGAPFSAMLFSFPFSAWASWLVPHFSTSICIFPSFVSFFTSVPMTVFTPTTISQAVYFSVSTSTPRSVSVAAPIPIAPPVGVTGSGWFVLSVMVGRPPLSTPASPPVIVSSAVSSIGPGWASAAATLLSPPVPISLRVPPVSVTSPHAAVWGQVQVPVSLPEFISRISKYMKEIAMLPFGALVSVKQPLGERTKHKDGDTEPKLVFEQ